MKTLARRLSSSKKEFYSLTIQTYAHIKLNGIENVHWKFIQNKDTILYMRLCVFKHDKNDKNENVFCWPLEILCSTSFAFREWNFLLLFFTKVQDFFNVNFNFNEEGFIWNVYHRHLGKSFRWDQSSVTGKCYFTLKIFF